MSRFTLPRQLLPTPTPPAPSAPQRGAARSDARLSRRAVVRSALALPLIGLALTACGTDEGAEGSDPASSDDPGAEATTDPAAPHCPVTITDPWVKAAEEGMTAVFGTLTNTSGTEMILLGASTDAADEVELHQTASDGSGGMSMEEKEGGFPIPAGGELLLEPGGDHIMLMGLTAPLLPGDEVELVLQFEGGTEHPMTATVKDFAGAQENYGGMEEPSDGGGEHGTEEHE
ncbi:copper chaperone PCu(A)C [Brachybacterium sp. p3-SID1565]|uniref:copper chaperone PCu(A)C n=1 Tax=Brachybacterium sp. p3-SID1565 TaxID=2916046 RepID=UPI0021A91EFA|nr:copper chaperone PCu(A)C [Brachybacterium sp. p3-SID1565]MCT1384646.1 copper chaperone PCu(A)C [Brachybacterium sp. p3-SID1565]